ncbi:MULTISPECIES: tyrosine-type recombinase/integrase [unclassified Marinobacter]|uniref:tyrosine-type recombinase/integrase n=1 Tax=unclassified Marinobacter TaxID=83889 RepID=UPI00200F4610|nr:MULTISPECIES: tyrosine-type recombinase/integrase [unclassified Marinobacter]MCL1488070.1 site-specific integrase [Marinobacter sp.]UQG55100.1 site-specific integrase [Marinobacter sp. M4C]UQG55103.1 site-specific integrase [Marinobacter sp. M4C]UQG55916.1 site-specific integrase [Marinobacter sp. M4C]UQG57295.1 site-specific integrase [Marinobacter sp. M4C]
MSAPAPLSFPCLLQRFFVQRLMQQQQASPCTVAAYRDSFRLLLEFAHRRLGKQPSDLVLDDLNAGLILDFLQYLEVERHNCVRSRNARFAAIRSFMAYVAYQEPSALAIAQSVLAIPMKRFEHPLVGFLSREHMQAIIAAPDQNTWTGQRDRVMFATLYNTGARVSELTGMLVGDLVLDPSASSIHIRGKGRKERAVPLWPNTAAQLKRWLRESPRSFEQPLFPNRSGGHLTRIGLTERLKLAVKCAARQYPELAKRRVFPHLIRHSIAMHMLQAGVDITVIALWLGHENLSTTHQYIEADLAMKERALKSLQALPLAPLRYRPSDSVLRFLQSL